MAATPETASSPEERSLEKSTKMSSSSWGASLRKFFKKIFKIISSPVGLTFILVAYSLMGAALFKFIEGGNESTEKRKIVAIQKHIIDAVWNISSTLRDKQPAFRLFMQKELRKYETQLHESFLHGVTSDSTDKVWDFWGSLFYVTTIHTTIGYGHIAPATDAGRIATMLYATFGIPLCLIIMASLGKLLTRGIKFLWSFVRRIYRTGHCLKSSLRKPKEGEQSELIEFGGYQIDEDFNLPVWVAILISIVYILLGALLYCQWENWTYLEASYFIFISISTIGFGDVLPNHPKYFLVSSVYVLFGLSLGAMVINVIVERMSGQLDKAKEKIDEVGKIIGVSVEDEPEPQSLVHSSNTSRNSKSPNMSDNGDRKRW